MVIVAFVIVACAWVSGVVGLGYHGEAVGMDFVGEVEVGVVEALALVVMEIVVGLTEKG